MGLEVQSTREKTRNGEGSNIKVRIFPDMDVVSTAGLGKTYPGGTEALRDVTLNVAKGHIFCVLGRNGAGKTTLLRVLGTQLRPTAGTATIFGHDVVKEPTAIRGRIASVPQESRCQMVLSGYDHILYMCLVLGMSRADARKRTQEIMEELELWEHKDKLAVDLSGGLRQRVIIAMALVASPELIFLDEPTIGLDPLGRRAVWHMVRELSKKGVTVILTTHYMDEAEALADRLAIIEKGRLAFLGTVEEAKAVTHEGLHVIVEPAVLHNSAERKVLKPQSNEEIIEIVQRSIREGLKVTFKPPTLEEAFIHIVGGSIEEDSA